jgi:predicted TIM-barrel fold metal-dependent hydrolase
MIVDCHVHTCADTPEHGSTSRRLRRTIAFRFMRWRLKLPWQDGAVLERALEAKLLETVRQTTGLDAVVLLAFDAVFDQAGQRDEARTHLYVKNDYVAELSRRHPELLFGASVHPYRKDAVAELERCVQKGAVLLKWLPIVQDFDPADPRCFPFYEALAHHRLPLLSHTGGELTLPNLNTRVADPRLLIPALKRGVTVIAAHCATRGSPLETGFLPAFVRMCHEYENLYGDTAALNLPSRSYAYDKILNDPLVRSRLVHGSDWPIISMPPWRMGWGKAVRLFFTEPNWLKRDVLAKQALGLGADYWERCATLLRWPARPAG